MIRTPLRFALGAGVAGLLALGGAGLANAATGDGSDTPVVTDDSTAATTDDGGVVADDGTTDDSTATTDDGTAAERGRPGDRGGNGGAGCDDAGATGSADSDAGTEVPATDTPSAESSLASSEL